MLTASHHTDTFLFENQCKNDQESNTAKPMLNACKTSFSDRNPFHTLVALAEIMENQEPHTFFQKNRDKI